jgi:alkylhydroperoxidase family enzyme
VRALVEHPDVAASPARNVYLTFGRHPGLLAKWSPFAGKLLVGRLPARDRELLILRSSLLSSCEYEWGHHVLLGEKAGIGSDDVEAVAEGPGSAHWSEQEAALLTAADELHDAAEMTDETWKTLAQAYDESQLIEIPLVVGQYMMLSFLLNTLRVEREPGVPGFDQLPIETRPAVR